MCLFGKKKVKEEEKKSPLLLKNDPDGFVDLGLSVKWARCNVGAEKPEDFGGYYRLSEAMGFDLPTADEWKELIDNCEFRYDKKRKLIIGKGKNGNEIEFPLANEKNGNHHYQGAYFWSPTPARPGSEFTRYACFYLTGNRMKPTVKKDMYILHGEDFWISVRTVKR